MRSNVGIRGMVFLANLCLLAFASAGVATAQGPVTPRTLPNPVPVYMGPEFFETGGKQWIRYRYLVENSAAYPAELFLAAPELPPCGQNTKASRTWVEIYDQGGKRLNGFCALGSPNDLGKLWFALEADVIPPSYVYIEMTDRKTNTKYKSILSETTQ
ncbi:MAG TPA: hypothetical protein VER76_05655 [Pyrinomonadaceae bacterium]|nr:hypothetical protein [Pyrinomonadaceae bacterium]